MEKLCDLCLSDLLSSGASWTRWINAAGEKAVERILSSLLVITVREGACMEGDHGVS